jgi:hypothetical protein
MDGSGIVIFAFKIEIFHHLPPRDGTNLNNRSLLQAS